jgi:hypothetical protein
MGNGNQTKIANAGLVCPTESEDGFSGISLLCDSKPLPGNGWEISRFPCEKGGGVEPGTAVAIPFQR